MVLVLLVRMLAHPPDDATIVEAEEAEEAEMAVEIVVSLCLAMILAMALYLGRSPTPPGPKGEVFWHTGHRRAC